MKNTGCLMHGGVPLHSVKRFENPQVGELLLRLVRSSSLLSAVPKTVEAATMVSAFRTAWNAEVAAAFSAVRLLEVHALQPKGAEPHLVAVICRFKGRKRRGGKTSYGVCGTPKAIIIHCAKEAGMISRTRRRRKAV